MAPSQRAMPAHRREAVNKNLLLPFAFLLAMAGSGARPKEGRDFFDGEEDAVVGINMGLAIVGTIIGAVVAIALVAALAPQYFTSLSDIGGVFTDPSTTTGNADADALLPVFGLLVAFGGLFAIVGLVLLAIKLKNSGA